VYINNNPSSPPFNMFFENLSTKITAYKSKTPPYGGISAHVSKSVSRVLSRAIIYLGLLLPDRLKRPYPGRGGPPHYIPYSVLLQVGFTEPIQSPGLLVSSYLTFPPLPSIRRTTSNTRRSISVALSLESPPLGVTQHPALWSSDFPQLHFYGVQPRSPDLLTCSIQFAQYIIAWITRFVKLSNSAFGIVIGLIGQIKYSATVFTLYNVISLF